MPVYVLTIVILALMVAYLIYRLTLASKEKSVVLITLTGGNTLWKIFDSMIEAKAFIKTNRYKNYYIIKTTRLNMTGLEK